MRIVLGLVGALGLLIGCGDPGGTASADAATTAACRAPAGCSAYINGNARCDYTCTNTDVRVCIPISDGGVVGSSGFDQASGYPPAEIRYGDPRAINVSSDPTNCGRCGRVCLPGAPRCLSGACQP